MSFLKISNFLFSAKIRNIPAAKLWGYVAIAFNKVDYDRLQLVGPDRLCAEWVLKNGGAVSFTGAPGRYLSDYNILPPENVRFYIKEVDASNASVMKIGLEHFKDCKYIDKIIFHNCKHLEEDGLIGLTYLINTLRDLQVSGCYNISDDGLKIIKELKHLKHFKIFDMPYVKNIENVAREIRTALPGCEIDTSE